MVKPDQISSLVDVSRRRSQELKLMWRTHRKSVYCTCRTELSERPKSLRSAANAQRNLHDAR